jgi:hypothetical protein
MKPDDIEWMASLINENELSDADRKRLSALRNSQPPDDDDTLYYGIAAWGTEGLDMFMQSTNIDDIVPRVAHMELRARFNSQRRITGYAFSSYTKLDWEVAEKSEKFRELVEEKGIRIF